MRSKPALALFQLAYSLDQTTKEIKPLIRINAQPSSNQIKLGFDSICLTCTLNTYRKVISCKVLIPILAEVQ